VGPTRGWSKVVIATTVKKSLKRKDVPMSNSDYDVEEDAQDITQVSNKRTVEGKKVNVEKCILK